MGKTILLIGGRVIIAAAVLALVTITYKDLPKTQAQKAIDEHRLIFESLSDNQDLLISLEGLVLKDLQVRNKASIEAYYKGAQFGKSESEKNLNITKKNISIGPEIPFRDELYREAKAGLIPIKEIISSLNATYQELFDLFNYYEASSLALYNILYYDPVLEIKAYEETKDYEILLQAYGSARDGLLKTVERLEKLPNYSDPTIKSFVPEIKDLAREAGEISDNAVNNTAKSYELAKAFIPKVNSLQDRVISDRKKFWGENEDRKELITKLNETLIQIDKGINLLGDFRQKLNQIP